MFFRVPTLTPDTPTLPGWGNKSHFPSVSLSSGIYRLSNLEEVRFISRRETEGTAALGPGRMAGENGANVANKQRSEKCPKLNAINQGKRANETKLQLKMKPKGALGP